MGKMNHPIMDHTNDYFFMDTTIDENVARKDAKTAKQKCGIAALGCSFKPLRVGVFG
jgi:hypothetical protein